MKKLHLLFAGAFAALAIVACSDDEIESGTEYDEAWYAANATISSSDSHFSFTEDGEGMISFKTEGGSVTVNVDCGTEWTAENSASDIFGYSVQSAGITVTAEQNLVEEELHGTITLMTAESKIQFATISITQNAYGAPEITVTANEWHVPAVAATAEELTTEIGVEANDEWSVECNVEWLKAEKGGDSVRLTATENETFEERVAEVVLTCTDGYNSDSETITVTQDARAYINLSEAELQFGKAAGETTVTVDANYDWSCVYESDWFAVTADITAGTLTVTCNANETGEVREGTVTVTVGDGEENVAEATLAITQSIYEAAALVLEYTITSDNTTIQLPLGEKDRDGNVFTIDCTVDWGDGSEVKEVISSFPSHTYSAGTYNVIINGTVEELHSYDYDKVVKIGNTTYYGYPIDGVECLTAVKQWGDTELKSMDAAFRRCTNLASLPDGPGPFSNVTSFYHAFGECTSLTTVPEDMFSGCIAAENFEYVFDSCSSLTSVPSFKGLSNATDFWYAFWDCESLTTLPEDMFSGCTAVEWFGPVFGDCTSLTTVPANLFADCPSVGSFYGVFYGCTSLETVPVGIFDNNKSVTDFSWAFTICESLTTVPEDMFSGCTAAENFEYVFGDCTNLTSAPSFKGLSNATDFYCAFYECYSLTTIPEDMFSGCTAAENFEYVFYYCTNLTSAPSFKGLTKATDFYCAFWDCTSLTTIPEDMFSGCTAAENFEYTFCNCIPLTSVPANLFADCPSVVYFDGVFSWCSSLKTVPVGIFDNNKLVIWFDYAFYDCSKLVGESPYTVIEGNNVHLYERENYTDYFTAPTDYSNCFTDCVNLDDYYSIPSGWGGGASPTSITPQSLNAISPEELIPSRLGPQKDAIGPRRDAATPQGPASRPFPTRK